MLSCCKLCPADCAKLLATAARYIAAEFSWSALETPLFAAPAPISDNKDAVPKRSQKCLSTSSAPMPATPKLSTPGELKLTDTPSGVINRVHTIKIRDCPCNIPLLYCPINRLPGGIKTCDPSSEKFASLTIARKNPGKSEFVAGSKMAWIKPPSAIKALNEAMLEPRSEE